MMKMEVGGSSELSLPICHTTIVNCVTSQVTVIPESKKFFILLTGPFSPVGTTWCVSSMTGRMYGTLPPIWSTWSHIISSSTLVTLMLLLVLPSVRMMTRKGLTLPKYQVTSTLFTWGFKVSTLLKFSWSCMMGTKVTWVTWDMWVLHKRMLPLYKYMQSPCVDEECASLKRLPLCLHWDCTICARCYSHTLCY